MADTNRGRVVAATLVVTALLLLLGPSLAPAKPVALPLLWEAKGEPHVYVFGSLSVPDPRAQDLPPAVERAYDASDVILAELPLDDEDRAREEAQRRRVSALPPEAGGLKKVLGEALWKRVAASLPKSAGMSTLESREPWYVRTLVVRRFLEDQFPNARQTLDRKLYDKAGWDSKAVAGLDTVPEHIEIFDTLSLERQVAWLKATVDRIDKDKKEEPRQCSRWVQAYKVGDLVKIQSIWKEDLPPGESGTKLARALLDDRNQRMVGRLAARLKRKPEQTYFVILGAHRLAGEKGVLKLLAEKGCALRRVGVGDPVK